MTTIKTEDALAAIETCIKWGEENFAATGTLTTLRKLKSDVLLKMYKGKKQSTIDKFFI